MKKFKLSQQIQDIIWGIVFTITALTFMWVVSLFC